jgi:FixJ family two-component response regulator
MDVVLKGKKSGIDGACVIVENNSVPILFMTGNTHLLNHGRVKKIPVYRILEKPPSERLLMDTIEKLLKND